MKADRANSVIFSDQRQLAYVDVEPARVSITPLIPNPDRINIFKQPDRRGLKVWTYKGQESQVFIGYSGEFIRLPREMLPVLRIALRKYTKMKVTFIPPKPRPSGVDYEPPPDKTD